MTRALCGLVLFAGLLGAQTCGASNPHCILAGVDRTDRPSWRIIPVGDLGQEPTALTFAQARLKVWQARLGLTHWAITVELAPARTLTGHTIGELRPDPSTFTALIRVLDPADYQATASEVRDTVESIVVHELVHLSLTPLLGFQRTPDNLRQEEAVVKTLTAALLGR